MSTSIIKLNSQALAGGSTLTLRRSLNDEELAGDSHWDEGDHDVDYDTMSIHDPAPLSNKVIGLREWGTSRLFSLRAPQHAKEMASAEEEMARMDTTALQLTRADLAAVGRVEIAYEGRSWRVKDWSGFANLKQDGRPTREVSLMPGTEVTITGRTFIAESPRSIALRNFCSRLLGWGDDHIATVDDALRAIRLAGAGRVPLTLIGCGDLVPVALAIHRYCLGNKAPFIVSDPRRKGTGATVRSPANYASGVDAFRAAHGGTLCVRAQRLPRDFAAISNAFRAPGHSTQLMICSRKTMPLATAQIDIPSLHSRHADLPRLVSEYIEDAVHALNAPDDCLNRQDIQWILEHSDFGSGVTISGIEKATLRAVAIKMTGDLTGAARLLGMARVSLERWVKRRNDDQPEGAEPEATEPR